MDVPEHCHIIGMRIDATSYGDAVARILSWAAAAQSRYVCVATAHMVMEAYDSSEFRRAVNAADLVTPDGMPLVWLLRASGLHGQQRVYGPDLTIEVCRAAEATGAPVGFYGGRPEAINRLQCALRRQVPGLNIAYAFAPPFRPLTPEEDRGVVDAINASGTRILFVGLGCPKQELWMAGHKGAVRAAMVGVGAAFDFHAGLVKQAPRWLQAAGLEWAFRLLMEPRRLWRRYLKHNPRFAALAVLQILGLAHHQHG